MANVDTKHPEYQKMAARWKKCEDASEGQHAIHAGGTTYLPSLKDQSKSDYDAMKSRANFYNATWRTIAGLTGMLFRKPPTITAPAAIEEMLKDVTLTGEDMQAFAQDIVIEALTVGRVGVLVDYPQVEIDGITVAEAEALNLRPILQKFDALSIINWKVSSVNNRQVPTLVVIEECNETTINEFKSEEETRFLVLDLVDGIYRQRVFRLNEKGHDELVSESYPKMNGSFMTAIPFFVMGTDDIGLDVDSPPLEDLVDTNISHYRVTSDYEHGCHFTGLPTPVISGYTRENEGDRLYIGSTSAWVFPDPSASAKYLEFSGQGLGALERNLDRKEQQMAILGARMLSADKKGVEAADTAAIHRSGENSVLSSIAMTISQGLTLALRIFSEWAGAGTEASIEINREFIEYNLSAQDMAAIQGGWQSGLISHQAAFNKLQKSGFYDDSVTFEDEQSLIQDAPLEM